MIKLKYYISLFIILFGVSLVEGQSYFQIPSQEWALEIDLREFEIEKEYLSPDESAFQLTAFNKESNLALSIFIEKTNLKGDKKTCRDFYWSKTKKSPLAKENLKIYETKKLAIVEHDTKEYKGQIVDFHSLNAYLVKNDYWVDIHISKMGHTKEDEKIFGKICQSIRIK